MELDLINGIFAIGMTHLGIALGFALVLLYLKIKDHFRYLSWKADKPESLEERNKKIADYFWKRKQESIAKLLEFWMNR